jgi:hypothetical protein
MITAKTLYPAIRWQLTLLAVALACAASFTMFTSAHAQGETCVVTTGANVRSGPGTNFARVGGLQAGNTVDKLEVAANGWVRHEDGWTAGSLLNCNDTDTNNDAERGGATNTTSAGNGWTIHWYPAADYDRGDGTTFRGDAEKWVWMSVDVDLWPTDPNVDNPLTGFKAAQGIEVVNQESLVCEDNDVCILPVAPGHGRLFTGDYTLVDYNESCSGTYAGKGCGFLWYNVGSVTAEVKILGRQGWTFHGRFFDGGRLNETTVAVAGKAGNNMLNKQSELNPGKIVNAGGNCSAPSGCGEGLDFRSFISSGNEPLMKASTFMTP